MGGEGKVRVARGVQWSFRRARGTDFLPLKGSWRRVLLFCVLYQLALRPLREVTENLEKRGRVLLELWLTNTRRDSSASGCRRISAGPIRASASRGLWRRAVPLGL